MPSEPAASDPAAAAQERERLERSQQLWGWLGLFVFASLGLGLEALNGLKLGFYLDPAAHLRREMWRLAHAHGVLLSLLQIAFAFTLSRGWLASPAPARLAALFLRGALVLLPAGFFLGGVAPSESDPWIGVWLVPVGALLLLLALGVTAAELWRSRGRPWSGP